MLFLSHAAQNPQQPTPTALLINWMWSAMRLLTGS
jgi:hypothetical protein